jgi:hypothetical protein
LLGNFSATEFSELVASAELERFHQLEYSCDMTDIVDKELAGRASCRWETVFSTGGKCLYRQKRPTSLANINSLDHMMVRADAGTAHTMQHSAYLSKWNERLLIKKLKAYTTGRAETNPVDTWYKSEIGFFDFASFRWAELEPMWRVWCTTSTLEYALENRRVGN